MDDIGNSIAELLRRDTRYKFDAYVFVFEALRYAQEVLGYGKERPTETLDESTRKSQTGSPMQRDSGSKRQDDPERHERHVTGQELCEAIRCYALQQYGYMACCVLQQWGVTRTEDFGEIVFNLIEIGHMRKTNRDRREDFQKVFDFQQGLVSSFRFTPPD